MLLRLGRQTKGTDAPETPREAAPDLTVADFIPFTYHYDPHTLLTKNGELMQILRITASGSGVDYESPEPGVPALRDTLREALSVIDSDRYAYWFHTLRRRIPIGHQPAFPEGFAADMHAAWQEKCNWRFSFTNEVYISVMRQGQSSELFDFKEMTRTLIPIRNRRYRENFTDKAREELEANVSRMVEVLSKHSNVRRLTMVERPTGNAIGVYSEPMEFLHYLINLQPAAMPVQNVDASRQLSTHEITFGFDVAESRADNGKRRFAGLLTWKGTLELSPEVLDKCLQLPEEMIITQSFNYLPARQALEKQLVAKDLMDGSPDPFMAQASGLKTMVESDKGRPTDFGEQHTSIAIIRDQYKRLDEAIGGVQENFSKLGLVSVREEIRLEDCFWAQVPGNFPFLSRKTSAASSRIGGLARLNHFPSGRSAGNHWGAPLAIVPTTLGTPYFLNFHQDDIGHTALLDFNSFADERGTMLLNFLLTCSRQYGGRMVVLDRNHSAKPLIKALRGRYYHPLGENDAESGAACRFNPLQLPDTPRNRSFLAAWLGHFAKADMAQSESTRTVLKEALDALFTLPEEQRSLSAALERIAARDDSLLAPLNPLLDTLFGAETDSADLSRPVCAVEMLNVTRHRELIVPLFSYLLHRIVTSLDGKPTIIVLNEAWDLLDNPFFLPRIASLLDMLRQNNAMMIFTTRRFEDYLESPLTKQILEHTPTKLFIPDDIATNYFPEITGLTERETKTLLRMERQKGLFLVKHGKEVVECLFQENKLGMLSKTLAGDSKALRLMQIQQR